VVLTLSDRTGYLYKETGLTAADIDTVVAHKDTGANLDTVTIVGANFVLGKPWQSVVAESYFPCATQNEIFAEDAATIARHAVLVVEGANMPLVNEAITILADAHILHAPGKASNAGGVAVSGLEMAQNASHYPWTAADVEEKLVVIMERIHELCRTEGKEEWGINYVKGANIAGAKRVLSAMEQLGW
jgi:glutamate dehydrogenase (NADP+)